MRNLAQLICDMLLSADAGMNGSRLGMAPDTRSQRNAASLTEPPGKRINFPEQQDLPAALFVQTARLSALLLIYQAEWYPGLYNQDEYQSRQACWEAHANLAFISHHEFATFQSWPRIHGGRRAKDLKSRDERTVRLTCLDEKPRARS